MPRETFETLRDWRRSMQDRGRGHFIKENSPNPYIRRILRYANLYDWDYPFQVVVGKVNRKEKVRLLAEYRETVEEKKQAMELEKQLLKSIFGE